MSKQRMLKLAERDFLRSQIYEVWQIGRGAHEREMWRHLMRWAGVNAWEMRP